VNQLESLLSKGVSAEALESLDKHGNTPLLLAYRMGRTRSARMLLAAGAFSKARTPEGWEAIHVAALTGNPDLVRSSVVAFLKETDDAFQRRLPRIQASLENHAVHIEGLEKRETETGLVLRELRDTTARANAYLVALCQATPTARCVYP
jgi:hypothetical protein